jgi:hypothetical protein
VYTEFVLNNKATASDIPKYDAIERYSVCGREGIKWIKCALSKEVTTTGFSNKTLEGGKN